MSNRKYNVIASASSRIITAQRRIYFCHGDTTLHMMILFSAYIRTPCSVIIPSVDKEGEETN